MVTIMIKNMEVHKSDAGSRQGQAEQLRNSRNILLAPNQWHSVNLCNVQKERTSS